jgi:uncharacterized protein YciI
MPACYIVEQLHGPAYDPQRQLREQAGWDLHAAFMDGLLEEGFVLLGGPVGSGEWEGAVLVVRAEDEAAVRERLAEDPWHESVLALASVRPWTIWLGALPRAS